MTRIECNCTLCTTNAAKIGKSAPLAAMIPAKVMPLVKGRKGIHTFVYMANNPNVMDRAASANLGITAA